MREIVGWLAPDVGAAMRNLIWKVRPDVCVEIGVFAGKSLINTGIQLKDNGKGVIYGIDPWRLEENLKGLGQVSADEYESAEYWHGVDLDAVHYDCVRAVWQFELDPYVVLIRSTSVYASRLFPNDSIDILYIDGSHSEAASTEDCVVYLPKVRQGGHIWLDDTNYDSLKKAISTLEEKCQLVKDFGHSKLYKKT